MNNKRCNLTIFAPTTATNRSALHGIRISGLNAFLIISPFICDIKTKCALPIQKWQAFTGKPNTTHALLCDNNGEILDDIIIISFKAPHSFTGENCLEIFSHGNPIILQNIQHFLRELGFVDALPGEFSQRAFLNGKFDLVAVEALHELITTPTHAGVKLAQNAGILSNHTHSIRQLILDILSFTEAHIDFDSTEVGHFDTEKVSQILSSAINKLNKLAETFSCAQIQREGIKTAFIGAPNVGKSSLFNALLQKNRAIVTNLPGTTRDILEERICYNKRDFILLDTAGIRHSTDIVEQLGIELTHNAITNANIICLLIDISNHTNVNLDSFTSEFNHSLFMSNLNSNMNNESIVIVFTKSDIANTECLNCYSNYLLQLNYKHCVTVNQNNFSELLNKLSLLYDNISQNIITTDTPALISSRQYGKVKQAIQCLLSAQISLQEHEFPEIIAAHLYESANHITEITGEIITDDILGNIFSSFCIGK